LRWCVVDVLEADAEAERPVPRRVVVVVVAVVAVVTAARIVVATAAACIVVVAAVACIVVVAAAARKGRDLHESSVGFGARDPRALGVSGEVPNGGGVNASE
jgi:hypothetical protein